MCLFFLFPLGFSPMQMFLWKLQLKRDFIANFYFPERPESPNVALNSSCSQKSAIQTFTFAVSTFLSLTENGGNSTDYHVFIMLDVGELHNPD